MITFLVQYLDRVPINFVVCFKSMFRDTRESGIALLYSFSVLFKSLSQVPSGLTDIRSITLLAINLVDYSGPV